MSGSFKASVVILLAFAGVAALSLWSRPHEVIPWRTDYAQAVEESRRSHKPMLLDFSAEWCGPCQEMRRTTWSNRKVADALKDVIPVQIDVDQHVDLSRQFQVDGIPRVIELDSTGNLIRSQEGYLEPDTFLEWLNSNPSASASGMQFMPLGR